MADSVDDDLAAIRAALQVEYLPPAAAPPAAPRKAAKKAPAKKAPAKKAAAKKAPRKRAPARKAIGPTLDEVMFGPDEPVAERERPPLPELPDMQAQVAELEHPAKKAYDMKVRGLSWEEIADRTNYASAATAAAGVQLWMQNGALAAGREIAQQRAQMALDRTEAVINAVYDKAVEGDLDAAKVLLKANEDYFKIAGLEKAGLVVKSTNTIVISAGDDMGAQLEAAAREADARRHAGMDVQRITDVGDED